MEHLDIPEEQVIPLEGIAEGVQGVRIAFVNVFALTHSNRSWTLVDAGIPYSEKRIRQWAEKQFTQPPNAIVLTHGHFDHVSAAAALADHWGVPVFAHPLEFPYLTGEREYPAPNATAGGGMMSLLSPMYPRGPVNLGNRLRSLRTALDTGFAPELPGWRVLHTPGHTPGHISLFRPDGRVLLPADAFCTTKPESFFEAAFAQKPELHGPPAYFTSDWTAARESVEKLAALRPLVIAPGHGKAISGPAVASELATLAANFDAIAVPDNRKGTAV